MLIIEDINQSLQSEQIALFWKQRTLKSEQLVNDLKKQKTQLEVQFQDEVQASPKPDSSRDKAKIAELSKECKFLTKQLASANAHVSGNNNCFI